MNISNRIERFHKDESGMISIIAVLTVFIFAVLVALVINISRAVIHKLEVQNAADAVATSCGVQQARMLNTITAANHLTGELLALVVIHEALGRKHTSDSMEEVQETNSLDKNLTRSWGACTIAGINVSAYEDISKIVRAKYALLDSYRDLKYYLTKLYQTKLSLKAIGTAALAVPFIGKFINKFTEVAIKLLDLVEKYMHLEWKAVRALENAAKLSVPAKDLIYKLTPGVKQFQNAVVTRMPVVINQTFKAIAEQHGVEAITFPGKFGVTIREEAISVDDIEKAPWKLNNSVEGGAAVQEKLVEGRNSLQVPFGRSQIVRATYPWVNYHRQPLLNFPVTRMMVFSGLAGHYRDWSSYLTLTKSAEYYRQSGTRLLVLAETSPLDKGKEKWTENPNDLDRMFSMIAMVHQDSPVRTATSYFGSTNPGGTLGYAQVFVYNRNKQPVKNNWPDQPEVGWDTLNWKPKDWNPTPLGRAFEWPAFSLKTKCPEVWLNWQAKLVPATRMRLASISAPEPFKSILQRLDYDTSLLRSH